MDEYPNEIGNRMFVAAEAIKARRRPQNAPSLLASILGRPITEPEGPMANPRRDIEPGSLASPGMMQFANKRKAQRVLESLPPAMLPGIQNSFSESVVPDGDDIDVSQEISSGRPLDFQGPQLASNAAADLGPAIQQSKARFRDFVAKQNILGNPKFQRPQDPMMAGPSVPSGGPQPTRAGQEMMAALRPRNATGGPMGMAAPVSAEDVRRRTFLDQSAGRTPKFAPAGLTRTASPMEQQEIERMRAASPILSGAQMLPDVNNLDPLAAKMAGLPERAEAAKARLIENSTSGLARSASGGIIGDRDMGTPVNEARAGAARAQREAVLAQRTAQARAIPNRGQRRAMGMAQQQQANMLARNPQLAAAMMQQGGLNQRAMMESIMGLEHLKSNERVAEGRNKSAFDVATGSKRAREDEIAMASFLGDETAPMEERMQNWNKYKSGKGGVAAAPASGAIPRLRPVSDPNAAIEQIFQEVSASGNDDPAALLAAAKQRGISPDALRQWATENDPRIFGGAGGPNIGAAINLPKAIGYLINPGKFEAAKTKIRRAKAIQGAVP